MMQQNEKVVKEGAFEGIAYSSAKKYACEKGKLILTPKNLTINCEGNWSKTFSIKEIRLEAWDKNLEVRDFWYGRLLFKLIIDKPEEWEETFREVGFKYVFKEYESIFEKDRKRPEEWKKLFDINPKALKKIHDDIRKEMTQFRMKNIKFNLEIQKLVRIFKNRKLKAFIVVHSYVAWYEWTKGLLYKIYKAKFGKGPENDEELLKFLDEYPLLGVLNTKEWGIEANQIRNCVAHERFYYDYKPSELVFKVKKKEKRVRLRELEFRLRQMSHTYFRLRQYLREKVIRGEISYESLF